MTINNTYLNDYRIPNIVRKFIHYYFTHAVYEHDISILVSIIIIPIISHSL